MICEDLRDVHRMLITSPHPILCVCVCCVCVFVCVCVCSFLHQITNQRSFLIFRVGQYRVHTLYNTIYLVISLPKIPYIYRIYSFWPTLHMCTDTTQVVLYTVVQRADCFMADC